MTDRVVSLIQDVAEKEYKEIRKKCNTIGELADILEKTYKERRFSHSDMAEIIYTCQKKCLKEEMDGLPICKPPD